MSETAWEPPCERCGGPLAPHAREGASPGGLFYGRCSACGHEQALGIADPPLPEGWPGGTVVEVVLRWDASPPDARVLQALRKRVPGLAQQPPAALRAALGGRTSWSLGQHDETTAEGLAERARAEGLRAELGEPVACPDEDHCCIPFDPNLPPPREPGRDGDLCPSCGLRPGRPQAHPRLPVSDFLCDECAAGRVTITPFGVLGVLLALGVAGWGLWRLLG